MFCIPLKVVVTGIYTFVKIHRNATKNKVNFTECNFSKKCASQKSIPHAKCGLSRTEQSRSIPFLVLGVLDQGLAN